MNILIIGGGASGLIAALAASEKPENRITVVEKQNRVGRKILSSGNGRCNITNTSLSQDNYHGKNSSFALSALTSFSPEKTIDYFRSLGLVCQQQYGGRVYPLSESANSVLDVLRFACSSKGIEIVSDTLIDAVSYKKGVFHAFSKNRVFTSDRLIIACGGLAGGKLGGCSSGYELLKSFGHHCTKLYPALVPVTVEGDLVRSLKGIRVNVSISLNGKSSTGELQFTDNGISGPAVFDISREASVNGGTVHIDFLTGEIKDILLSRRTLMPDMECGSILTGVVHNRLSLAIVKYCGIKPSSQISELTDYDIDSIAAACRDFTLKIRGTGNFDAAQVTAGGISTDEFNPDTMESRLIPGLYACGEVLDIDGDCGGYNLQWAWSSGYTAGKSL